MLLVGSGVALHPREWQCPVSGPYRNDTDAHSHPRDLLLVVLNWQIWLLCVDDVDELGNTV